MKSKMLLCTGFWDYGLLTMLDKGGSSELKHCFLLQGPPPKKDFKCSAFSTFSHQYICEIRSILQLSGSLQLSPAIGSPNSLLLLALSDSVRFHREFKLNFLYRIRLQKDTQACKVYTNLKYRNQRLLDSWDLNLGPMTCARDVNFIWRLENYISMQRIFLARIVFFTILQMFRHHRGKLKFTSGKTPPRLAEVAPALHGRF